MDMWNVKTYTDKAAAEKWAYEFLWKKCITHEIVEGARQYDDGSVGTVWFVRWR